MGVFYYTTPVLLPYMSHLLLNQSVPDSFIISMNQESFEYARVFFYPENQEMRFWEIHYFIF